MIPSIFSVLALPAVLLPLAAAKTDLDGCTRTDISSPAGASYAWIVPETGELCDPLDCGGGRAPPKTTVPGCAAYSGTATYSPSYLPGFSAAQTGAASTTAAAASATATSSAFDDSDNGDDDTNDDDDDTDDDDDETWPTVWRSANNPSATFNPSTLIAWPSSISTYWIPVDLGSGTSTWEPVALTADNDGNINLVPAETPASSDLPAICAIATNSGCGLSTSTFSVTLAAATSTINGTAVATGSGSATKSWVKTVPTFSRNANGEIVRAAKSGTPSSSGSSSATASASASAKPSDGVAAGLKYSAGGVGVVAAMMGALVVL